MATWLPVAKAILPYLGDIISAAKPAFTKRKGVSEGSQIEILQQQVAELQNASLQNVQTAKALAEQLQTAVSALEQTFSASQEKVRRACWIAAIALGLSVIALGLSVSVLLRH
ncbi:hypothetical protein [Glaciimonas sp. PAMC28666]|uniref:hypothetical protein n=1 Tax=Glaciimonas sp. PAMC28666 TaxID=2807626 RepID=UPI001962FCBB|nr:hypothetical protein [Glaciimonas sp. PAMC28666]QRX82884.1 hypothetical protein JQN73_00775 [Glaciimonas sp. PAMC28666]